MKYYIFIHHTLQLYLLKWKYQMRSLDSLSAATSQLPARLSPSPLLCPLPERVYAALRGGLGGKPLHTFRVRLSHHVYI